MNAERSPSSHASSPDVVSHFNPNGGRRSLIFHYYHNVTETVTSCGGYISATCNICWMVLRGNKGVTSNFVSHLRRRHPSHYSNFVQCRAEQAIYPDSTVSHQNVTLDNSPPDDVEECSADSGQLYSETVAEITSYGVHSTSVSARDFRQSSHTTSEQGEISRASRAFISRLDGGLNRFATTITAVPNQLDPFMAPLTSNCYTSPSTASTIMVANAKTMQVLPRSPVPSPQLPVQSSSEMTFNSKQELVTRSLTKYVVQSLSPLSVVEEKAFRDLMRDLHPGCSVTSEYDLRVNILPEVMEKAVLEIRNELHQVENISLSVNSGETNKGCGPYRAVTAHFVKDGHLRNSLLICEPAGHVCDDFLVDQICKYRLEGKSYKTIYDSMRSVSYRLLCPDQELCEENNELCESDENSPCFERHLDAMVKYSIGKCELLRNVIAHASHLQENANRTRKIGSSDVLKGWNQDLKDIRQLLVETEQLSPIERSLLEETSSLLEPFEEVMDMVRSEQTVPVSLVLPSVVSLKKLLDSNVTTEHLRCVLTVLQQQLDQRFRYVFKDDVYAVAAFLDPRFKLSWCGDDIEERRALEMVRNAVGGGEVESLNRNGQLPSEPPKKKIFLQLRHNTARKQSCVDEEVKTYLDEPLEDERTDPVRFWYERAHGSKPLPLLSKLSEKVLSVPATSAPITRIFGAVHADLCSDDLQKLIFLKANVSFWPK